MEKELDFLVKSYEEAHSDKDSEGNIKIIPASDFDISKGQQNSGQNDGTTIYVGSIKIPRQILTDRIGDKKANIIWKWIQA
jgi:hypothetical protein